MSKTEIQQADDPSLQAAKTRCRAEARDRLASMSGGERRAASDAIVSRLAATFFSAAQSFAALLFSPLPDEPDVTALTDLRPAAWHFPCMLDGRIVARPAPRGISWRKGAFDIAEPDTAALGNLSKLEVAVIPGRAFAPDGTRLGRGGGHYDTFLATLPKACLLIGTCFDRQIFGSLPAGPHDIPMHWIVSESHIIDCRQRKHQTSAGL